jgi:intraflagellar transport protein 56
MIMSRAKNTKKKPAASQSNAPKLPQLEEYIKNRDYTGALTLLEFNKRSDDLEEDKKQQTLMWIGYCAFHIGDYPKALSGYQEVLDGPDPPSETFLYIACCQYYMQSFKEAEQAATKGPNCPLKNRILFHAAHRMNDEKKLMEFHQQLSDTKEDQLCLAAIHYLRNHYQEATDIYKRLLLENRDDLALNVYVAMCYYKLDYYDVSLEILAVYLQSFPDSAVAINLKACNHFRLYNGKAAESELKVLSDQGVNLNDNDLVKHNLVVFLNGEQALKVLPQLIDFIPEAKLNLVIYYLRNDEIQEAYDLIKDMEPSTPPEYILKGVVNACVGQATGSREHLKMAQQFFQLVGASASECDTIPGRQCMAQCFFLLKQFEDVNIYLNSIKAYLYNDDNFNWNFGISSAAVGNFKVGEETLLLVQNEKYRQDYTYISWLARCYINNNNARAAWDLYLKMESANDSNVLNLIQLIANDCYKMGAFYYAAKAFDLLERHDPDPEYWEGKRGACVGVFQMVVAGKERKENLVEVLNMLRTTSNPQVEYIMRTITKWCSDNGVKTE